MQATHAQGCGGLRNRIDLCSAALERSLLAGCTPVKHSPSPPGESRSQEVVALYGERQRPAELRRLLACRDWQVEADEVPASDGDPCATQIESPTGFIIMRQRKAGSRRLLVLPHLQDMRWTCWRHRLQLSGQVVWSALASMPSSVWKGTVARATRPAPTCVQKAASYSWQQF